MSSRRFPSSLMTLSWCVFQLKILIGFLFFGFGCSLFLLIWIPLSPILFLTSARINQRLGDFTVQLGFTSVIRYCILMRIIDIQWINKRKNNCQPQVIVANHVSFLDVLILVTSFPGSFSLVKGRVSKHPLLSKIISLAQFIPVDSENPESRAAAFQTMLSLVSAGRVPVIFPEGTRSADGKLGEFHKGIFKALMMTSKNLTPVLISTSEPFLNKSSLFKNSGKTIHFRITLLDDIDTPRPDIPTPRILAEFKARSFETFKAQLNRENAFAWHRESESILFFGSALLLRIESSKKCKASLVIQAHHPHFKGHFDSFPIMPAVGQIELVKEVLSALLQSDIMITQLSRAKFTEPIAPNIEILVCLEVAETPHAAQWTILNCQASNQLVSKGNLQFEVLKPWGLY